MEIGQVIDYVEEYNRMHSDKRGSHKASDKKQEDVVRRVATQSDWDALLG